jgi:hypothetical protein
MLYQDGVRSQEQNNGSGWSVEKVPQTRGGGGGPGQGE